MFEKLYAAFTVFVVVVCMLIMHDYSYDAAAAFNGRWVSGRDVYVCSSGRIYHDGASTSFVMQDGGELIVGGRTFDYRFNTDGTLDVGGVIFRKTSGEAE